MVGLRTQESSKFEKFFSILQGEATKLGKTFFLDCGEGRDFENDELEAEDLSGWLVDDNDLDAFRTLYEKGSDIGDKWANCYAIAKWNIDENIFTVKFEML